jgi:hypothetical protein
MRTRKQNKFAMYLAVSRCSQQPGFQRACRQVPAFRESWSAFRSVMDSILQHWQRAQLSTEGATESKAALRKTLATAATRISAGLVTWAEIHGNIEVARRAYVTPSTLLKGRDLIASMRAESLLTLARKHVAQLRDYGITVARLDAFEALAGQFAVAMCRPKEMIQDRKFAHTSLTRLFAEADQHLARIDRLTSLLSAKQATFVEAYRASRRIIQLPATRETVGHSEAEVAMAG